MDRRSPKCISQKDSTWRKIDKIVEKGGESFRHRSQVVGYLMTTNQTLDELHEEVMKDAKD
jgi:hypothetical protein